MFFSLNIIIIALIFVLYINIVFSWKYSILKYNPITHIYYTKNFVQYNKQKYLYNNLNRDISKLYLYAPEDCELTEYEEEDLFRSMSLELYDILRVDDEYLSITKFLEWEDITEILDLEIIDMPIINAIFNEIGVKNDIITYLQFIEAVELINEIEKSEFIGDEINEDDDSDDDVSDDDNDNRYGWATNLFN